MEMRNGVKGVVEVTDAESFEQAIRESKNREQMTIFIRSPEARAQTPDTRVTELKEELFEAQNEVELYTQANF
jgi:hypothetical protein